MIIPEQVERLVRILEEGARLLTPCEVRLKKEQRWSEVLANLAQQLKSVRTPDELKEFIAQNGGLFGGMGSLNDLALDPRNGHVADDFTLANKRLNEFADELWNEWKRTKAMLGLVKPEAA